MAGMGPLSAKNPLELLRPNRYPNLGKGFRRGSAMSDTPSFVLTAIEDLSEEITELAEIVEVLGFAVGELPREAIDDSIPH